MTAAFVAPARARTGVASALLARLEREAFTRGEARLFLRAAPGAVPFYAARGYRRLRRIRVPLPGGLALGGVAMTKRLVPRR